MESNSKKLLKISDVEFYKLYLIGAKAKNIHTFKNFKNGGVHKATIYRWLDKG